MVVYFELRKQDKYRHDFILINIGLIHNYTLLLIHTPTQILLALDGGKYFYKMPGHKNNMAFHPTICTTRKISLFLHGEFELDRGQGQSWSLQNRSALNLGEVQGRRADILGLLDDGAVVVHLDP